MHRRKCNRHASSHGSRVPVALIIGVLLYLHRRNLKKQRHEDLNDPHKSLDFGLGNGTGKASRKSLLGKEKDGQGRYNRQQMSMDMNLSSPYLLPLEMQKSRESLAKTLHPSEDPYRLVKQYAASETGSIRSGKRGHEAASVYTRSSSHADFLPPLSSPGPYNSPSWQNSVPRSTLLPPEPSHMKPGQPVPEQIPSDASPRGPHSPVEITASTLQLSQDESMAIGVAVQEPPSVVQKSAPNQFPSPSQPSPADSGVALEYGDIGNPFEKPEAQEVETPTEPTTVGLGLTGYAAPVLPPIRTSISSSNSQPTSPTPQNGRPPQIAPVIEEPLEYFDYGFADMPEIPSEARSTPPENHEVRLDGEEPRGRNMQRMSHLYEQHDGGQGGLGIPQQDNRRLSVGFRPLPPDDIMESEDPEYRANRIRSFYKEYFDESKAEDRPPVPHMPTKPHQQHGSTNYYEDYDAGYGQDAAYFDPATNSFVMPYAQPVSRRAMTPPPSGQRFAGPRGPPRAYHGSQANVRLPPNIRGPPRPGSSVSNQLGGPSRPGSSMSGPYGRPRAGSVMSGSRAGSRLAGPRKPMPPPVDLSTLPTPSKLKDDSFAIFNAIDFAPPETFADRARGRSQSPVGERRPYKMNVPAHSPLVNAFEELPVLPSP